MIQRFHRCAPAALLLVLSGCGLAIAAEDFTTERIASGLSRPLGVHSAPNDADRLFIVEQRLGPTGRIRILDLTANPPALLDPPFLALQVSRGGEQGLLGMAFHPNYANNGRFFINYTDPDGTTIVAEYSVSANPNLADAESARTILTITQPEPNHNGGWMAFGPDGYLYFAAGDGGGTGDPTNQAQNLNSSLLGKMLRIDVDRDDFPSDANRNYGIPNDNPFVGVNGRDEIWAYGLRNPWRCAFDRLTGDLWIADVGQSDREEINLQPADSTGGENYGWRCFEGTEGFANDGGCPNSSSATMPVFEYSHDTGNCSITGGFVYRGTEICPLRGEYLYADFCRARIWGLRQNPVTGVYESVERTSDFAPSDGLDIRGISSFGQDSAGNLYICDIFDGEVFRIVPTGAPSECFVYGDLNCDNEIGIDDVTGFVTAFLSPSTYGQQFAGCDAQQADINEDGRIDARDIGPFVALVLGSGS